MRVFGKGEPHTLSTKTFLVCGKRYRISSYLRWSNSHRSSHCLFLLSSLPSIHPTILSSIYPSFLPTILSSFIASSIVLFIYHPSILWSFHPSIHPSLHLSTLPSILLHSFYPFFYFLILFSILSVGPPILSSSHSPPSSSVPSIHVSILSVLHSFNPFICTFFPIHPSILPSIQLFIHPFVQLTCIYMHPFSPPSVAMSWSGKQTLIELPLHLGWVRVGSLCTRSWPRHLVAPCLKVPICGLEMTVVSIAGGLTASSSFAKGSVGWELLDVSGEKHSLASISGFFKLLSMLYGHPV